MIQVPGPEPPRCEKTGMARRKLQKGEATWEEFTQISFAIGFSHFSPRKGVELILHNYCFAEVVLQDCHLPQPLLTIFRQKMIHLRQKTAIFRRTLDHFVNFGKIALLQEVAHFLHRSLFAKTKLTDLKAKKLSEMECPFLDEIN